MTARLATWVIAVATLAGLTLGAALPGLHLPRATVLSLLFVQTIIGAGSLAGNDLRAPRNTRWLRRVLFLHLVTASLPLWILGLVIGLDSPLGIGAFTLGAAPPAMGLPTYVAACDGDVAAAVQCTAVGYTGAVIVTPTLLFIAFGSTDHLTALGLTLLVGLIAPLIAAIRFQSHLRRIPRPVSFGIIACTIVVLMTVLGAIIGDVAADPDLPLHIILAAGAIGIGRCAAGALIGARWSGDPARRVEGALAVGTKNSVLAAVVASTLGGPLAATPAIANAAAELALVIYCSSSKRWGTQSTT